MTSTATPVNAAEPSVQVIAQYVKDLSFESPHAPESLVSNWPMPDVSFQISLRQEALGKDTYECAMILRVEAKKPGGENKICFIVDLTYAGLVALKNVAQENHAAVLTIEVPKLLFPFAREIISDLTIKGGYPPLFLQPVNFEALYLSEVNRLRGEAAKTANA